MKISAIAIVFLALISPSLLCGCATKAQSHETSQEASHEESHGESGHPQHTIIVTSPVRKDVVSTQQYVSQIHSCQHIEVCALEGGYLEEIRVSEGQAVRKGELMFRILPTLHQARLDSEIAEAQRIQIELDNADVLRRKGIVSAQEIAIKKAELAKANAKVQLARAELAFTEIKAPFDGIVDRQMHQLGSLIEEGDVLTTFSDNSLMWVYFNIPEARYFEYQSELKKNNGPNDHLRIELKLANGEIFPRPGKIGAIEADFNNETGNIAFRADFPNPNNLLRNGQTGTILIHRTLPDTLVIPQRATFEILAKQYVYVVDQDNVVHQRDIHVVSEQEDIFVIEQDLEEGDRIVLEGIRQVRDGDTIECEYREPAEVFASLKYHAE
ncbi:MAG: efflux RND transporter periplasmic adaptor subunit [Planctomycetaceae bacterium]|nr:efflux RND transporter periplasmic adaptor subunit [Planctomycetaceae bacterium]